MLDLDPLRGLSDALLGQVLPGSGNRRYPLRERIGEGGQGWVFRATWNGSVDVVVKVLRPDATSPEALGRFEREAQVLRMLSQQPSPNPHVVRFYDHAYDDVYVAETKKTFNLPFTVLEFVDGETLEQALARTQPAGLGVERARRIFRHVVLALEDVHARNVIHRDLKPGNILLASSGEGEIAKVTDFGLAKLLGPGMQRTTNLAGATVGYAPPEQFEPGNLRVAPPTDVFSLAAIFYELLTGAPAFPCPPDAHPLLVVIRILNEAPPTLAGARDRLPPELRDRPDIVAALDIELSRALSQDPAKRHATVTELRATIERALSELGPSTSIAIRSQASRGVVVRPGDPPQQEQQEDLAATIRAEGAPESAGPQSNPVSGTAPMLPLVRVTTRNVSDASALRWRNITSALAPGAYPSIAVAEAGGTAVGLGPRGPALWRKGQWTRLELPPDLEPGALRAGAWLGERLFVAGAGRFVVSVEGRSRPTVWRLDTPGLVLRGAFADETGIVLAGERATASGPVGAIVEIPLARQAGPALRVSDVPGSSALHAAVRVKSGILACGDAGVLAFVRPGETPAVVRACGAALLALLPMADGTAITVGRGGFVFRVWPTLEVQLDAVQTTRDLLAVARDPAGTLWCAGDAGRVLRRASDGWRRVGTDAVEGRVCGLHASGHRLLAFCDDGSVFEGVAQ